MIYFLAPKLSAAPFFKSRWFQNRIKPQSSCCLVLHLHLHAKTGISVLIYLAKHVWVFFNRAVKSISIKLTFIFQPFHSVLWVLCGSASIKGKIFMEYLHIFIQTLLIFRSLWVWKCNIIVKGTGYSLGKLSEQMFAVTPLRMCGNKDVIWRKSV